VIGERFNAYGAAVVSRCNRRRRQNSSGFERILIPMNFCANVHRFVIDYPRARTWREIRQEIRAGVPSLSFFLSRTIKQRKRVIHGERGIAWSPMPNSKWVEIVRNGGKSAREHRLRLLIATRERTFARQTYVAYLSDSESESEFPLEAGYRLAHFYRASRCISTYAQRDVVGAALCVGSAKRKRRDRSPNTARDDVFKVRLKVRCAASA
jgi:hypothetical protein